MPSGPVFPLVSLSQVRGLSSTLPVTARAGGAPFTEKERGIIFQYSFKKCPHQGGGRPGLSPPPPPIRRTMAIHVGNVCIPIFAERGRAVCGHEARGRRDGGRGKWREVLRALKYFGNGIGSSPKGCQCLSWLTMTTF